MNPSLERFGLRVMSGEARGVGPALLRGALALAEPFYAGAMMLRNCGYDAGVLKSHALPRPVVSVGNLTAGGTGKTPVVRWLAEQLIARGRRPAVLLRGYGKPGATFSDEQQLLQAYLDGVAVVANPDRRAGAVTALERQPQTDVILLDDAFQHRKVARNVDLVLINAAEPFGFGHVHPRGLLREPLRGLRRADAIIITRADQASADALEAIERRVRRYDDCVLITRAEHAHVGFRSASVTTSEPVDIPLETLRGRRYCVIAGIGQAFTFFEQLERLGGIAESKKTHPDHYHYTDSSLANDLQEAMDAGAEIVITTEKDWAKLTHLPSARNGPLPIWRVEMRIRFQRAGDESKLLELIEQRVARSSQRVTSTGGSA